LKAYNRTRQASSGGPFRERVLPVLLFVITSVIILPSCQYSPGKSGTAACAATADQFFGLCSYINDLIDEYTTAGYTVDKTVTLNDHSETHNNMEVSWRSELQPLASAYINRSAWVDKFRTDTTVTAEGYSVIYASSAANIPVKEMEVRFIDGADGPDVESIRVKTSRKNLLYTSNQEILLAPGRYYEVSGKQRTLFLSKTTFGVRADMKSPVDGRGEVENVNRSANE
jgi:hypothetical protein